MHTQHLAAAMVLLSLTMATAFAQERPAAPSSALHSPYLAVHDDFHLPLHGKPTVAVLVSPKHGACRGDLIRALRYLKPRFGDKVTLAVVIVDIADSTPHDVVSWANEQQAMLQTGMREDVSYTSLKDDTGEWYRELGKPTLPHALLVTADGKIAARELFQGKVAWELQRIEAAIAGKPATRPSSSDNAADHPFYNAVLGVGFLAHPDVDKDCVAPDTRTRAINLLDYRAIVRQLRKLDDAAANTALRDFVMSTTHFTIARKLSRAAVEQWPAGSVEWAADFLKTEAVGMVLPDHDVHLEGELRLTNTSATREMHFNIETRMISAWNNAPAGSFSHYVIATPGSSIYLTDDHFQGQTLPWGDYRMEYSVRGCMSEGIFPKHKYSPHIERKWTSTLGHYLKYADDCEQEESAGLSLPARAISEALATARHRAQNHLADQEEARSRPATRPASTQPATMPVDSDEGVRTRARQQLIGQTMIDLEISNWVQGPDRLTHPGGRLAHGKGRVMLIDFMFTSCPPCRQALPALSKLHETLGEQGMDVVSVCLGSGAVGLYSLVDSQGLKHAVAVLKADEEKKYNVPAYPTYVLIGRDGKIRDIRVGDFPEDRIIKQLLDEKP